MKIKFAALLAFLFVLACQVSNMCAANADEYNAPVTAAEEEVVVEEEVITQSDTDAAPAKEEAPAQPATAVVAPAAAGQESPEQVAAPEPAATQPDVVEGQGQSREAAADLAATLAEQDQALNTPVVPSVPNPYTNVSDPEFYLLQILASELAVDAKTGLAQADADAHVGRYGEENYMAMLKSFSEASDTLDEILHNSPIDIRKVHMTIKALKTLVVDIDDVFVYNPTYLNQMRGWNECKRILRRIDGTVYQEGALRRLQTVIDSNQFMKDIGKFLNMNGSLGRMGDGLHRNNPTGPMDRLVGRHTGARRAATVWMLPSGTYQSQATNPRSDMNEAVQQY